MSTLTPLSITLAVKCGHTATIDPTVNTLDPLGCDSGCTPAGIIHEGDLGLWTIDEDGELVSTIGGNS